MYHDLKIYCSMLLSTIPKSPPKIIRENTYTDSVGIEKNESVFIISVSEFAFFICYSLKLFQIDSTLWLSKRLFIV